MANGLPLSIRMPFAMHTRPSARVSRASYAPVVTPVTRTRSSWSTAPSGSFAHWLGPKAEAPAGASSSDLTVEEIRFQKRVSYAVAGWARTLAANASSMRRFMVTPRFKGAGRSSGANFKRSWRPASAKTTIEGGPRRVRPRDACREARRRGHRLRSGAGHPDAAGRWLAPCDGRPRALNIGIDPAIYVDELSPALCNHGCAKLWSRTIVVSPEQKYNFMLRRTRRNVTIR